MPSDFRMAGECLLTFDAAKRQEEDDEEEELKKLQAEMAM